MTGTSVDRPNEHQAMRAVRIVGATASFVVPSEHAGNLLKMNSAVFHGWKAGGRAKPPAGAVLQLGARVRRHFVRVNMAGLVGSTATAALATEAEEMLLNLSGGLFRSDVAMNPRVAVLMDIVIIEKTVTRVGGNSDIPGRVPAVVGPDVIVNLLDDIQHHSHLILLFSVLWGFRWPRRPAFRLSRFCCCRKPPFA
jgi:hypothetical protein